MTKLEIRVRTRTDIETSWPEYDDAKPLTLKGALIVEKATTGKQTGVALYFTGENGETYYVNTTARILANGLAAAIRGTAARFGDDLNQP